MLEVILYNLIPNFDILSPKEGLLFNVCLLGNVI